MEIIQLSVKQVLEIQQAITASAERLRELGALIANAINTIKELEDVVDKLKDSQGDLRLQHVELSTKLQSFPTAKKDIESIDRDVREIKQTLFLAQKRMDGLSQLWIATAAATMAGIVIFYATGQHNKSETPKKSDTMIAPSQVAHHESEPYFPTNQKTMA